MDPLSETVLARIREDSLISSGTRLLIACSGGKDSMALLYIMVELAEELDLTLGIYHLDHGMRGRESDEDRLHVQKMADGLGLAFHDHRYDFSDSRQEGTSFEEEARKVRYTHLGEYLSGKYDYAATGHTRDDQVETILLRIIRGTGIQGLAGIPPARGRIVRPLLDVTSGEIHEFNRRKGVQWREDRSNRDLEMDRNFIRNEIIPGIENRFPSFTGPVLRLMEHAGEYRLFAERYLDRVYQERVIKGSGKTLLEIEEDEDPFLFREVMKGFLYREKNFRVNRAILEEMERRMESNRINQVLYEGRGWVLERCLHENRPSLVLREERERIGAWEIELNMEKEAFGDVTLPGSEVRIRYAMNGETGVEGEVMVALPHSASRVSIRNRRRGDRIRLERGSRKINEILIDMKCPPDIREQVPILQIGTDLAALMPGLIGRGKNRVAPLFHVQGEVKKILAIAPVQN